MSYKGKMYAWGLDRAIAAKGAGLFPEVTTFEQLIAEGEKFAVYAYEPEEELITLMGQIGDILMKCDDPLARAAEIQAELDMFKEQMPLHLAKNEPVAKAN